MNAMNSKMHAVGFKVWYVYVLGNSEIVVTKPCEAIYLGKAHGVSGRRGSVGNLGEWRFHMYFCISSISNVIGTRQVLRRNFRLTIKLVGFLIWTKINLSPGQVGIIPSTILFHNFMLLQFTNGTVFVKCHSAQMSSGSPFPWSMLLKMLCFHISLV